MKKNVKRQSRNAKVVEVADVPSSWLDQLASKKQVFFSVVACIALTMVVSLFFLKRSTSATRGATAGDYLSADAVFQEWLASSEEVQLESLSEMIGRHPELMLKFNGEIAQKLSMNPNVSDRGKIVDGLIDRVEKITPFHARFAKTSLAIVDGNLEQALTEALQLEGDFQVIHREGDASIIQGGEILRAFNLLRIAQLQQGLGSVEGERHAWQHLKQIAGWEKDNGDALISSATQEAFTLLQQNFQKNGIGLRDYIEYREKSLD